uniref:Uncharacterized protein n=1 Tax=Ascaris lumbricoides TaxID=6252 RepID=A0A9J2PG45_ASCLU
MGDNKVNMSLDDIIKKERADRNKRTPARRGLPGKRSFAVRRNIRGGMRSSLGRGARGGSGASRFNREQQQSTPTVNKSATMRMVNKLVKRAINQRANQTLIQRAAMSRRRTTARVLATRVSFGTRRGTVRGSRLYGRLRGVSQRSRVIAGSAARRARRQVQQQQQLVLSAPIRKTRGRGVSRIGQLVSDSSPVTYEREIVRPVAPRRRFVRSVPVIRQPAVQREVILEQSTSRPIVVERAPRYTRTVPIRGIRKNSLAQQRVIVVNNVRRRPQFRVERVVEVQPRRRFVNTYTTSPRLKALRDAQLREALGITRGQRMEPERFEASSSFLQRVPVRKGRGFRNDNRFVY